MGEEKWRLKVLSSDWGRIVDRVEADYAAAITAPAAVPAAWEPALPRA